MSAEKAAPAAPPPPLRIAISGGPGAGKSSVVRAFADRHPQRAQLVPEVATLLFAHVFPSVQSAAQRMAVQSAIYHTQLSLEAVYAERQLPAQVLLCDRGTVDGAGYWPDGIAAFFTAMQTDPERELGRYDAVLFLESAAVGGHSISQGNPTRLEDAHTAIAINEQLRSAWAPHRRVVHVAHTPDFASKVERGVQALQGLLGITDQP